MNLNKSIAMFVATLGLMIAVMSSGSRTSSSEAATRTAQPTAPAMTCELATSSEKVVDVLGHPTSWTCSAPQHWCPNVGANCAQGVNCNLCALIGATCP